MYSTNRTTVNITKDCKEKPCITKCCSGDRIFLREDNSMTCADFTYLEEVYKFKPNYSLIEIHNKDVKTRDVILTETIYEHFVVLFNMVFFTPGCFKYLPNLYGDSEKRYILEDGTLLCRGLNHANQWFGTYSAGEFCVELEMRARHGALVSKVPEIVMYRKNSKAEKKTPTISELLKTCGILVSGVFMALVLLVYALLPELRNLMGLVLMAYLTITIVFFLARTVHLFANQYRVLDDLSCSVMTLIFYYSVLSSFAWLNVISFNIWLTLRRCMPVTMNSRRDCKGRRHVPKQFWWYNLHGWGTPLVVTVFVIVVDLMDLRHIPAFVKPHIINGNSCFMEGDEYWRYVTIPLMVLVSANLLLFVMTAVRIWLTRRNIKAFGSKSKNTGLVTMLSHILWFKTFVTLSLVMGITWMFEPLSNTIAVDSVLWYISDAANPFVGVFLFVVLVCKKKVFLSLCSKFSINNAFVRKLRAREPGTLATDHQRSTHSTACATTSVDVNAHPTSDQELNEEP